MNRLFDPDLYCVKVPTSEDISIINKILDEGDLKENIGIKKYQPCKKCKEREILFFSLFNKAIQIHIRPLETLKFEMLNLREHRKMEEKFFETKIKK